MDLEKDVQEINFADKDMASIFGQGVNNAIEGLSQMAGREVKVVQMDIKKVPVKDIPDLFGGPEALIIAIYLEIFGKANGHMVVVYQPEVAFGLVDLLLEKTCYHIIGISRSPEKNPVFLPYKKRDLSRFTFFQMDLNKDSKKMIKLFDKEKPKIIVNFAAQSEVGPSWITPEHWFRTNSLGIVNLTNELKNKKYLGGNKL